MRFRLAGAVGLVVLLVAGYPLAAQTPSLSDIEAPYPALQSSVHIAGVAYGPGAVPYGPVGTPLTLSGSDFGPGGAGSTILFPSAQKGTTIAATATSWSGSVVLVNIPSGATSGLVQVSVGGQSSNGLPLIVTSGTYVGTCPSSPPGSEVAIITSSLPNGTVGSAYSATLSAEGGSPPYTWSMTGGPSWLSLASTGVLTGTPTAAGGPYNLVVQVKDSTSQVAEATLSLSVDSQTLVAGTVYSYTAVYDPAGNVKGYSDYLNAQTNYVMGMWAFGYDTLNRLMSATPGPGAPGNYTNLNLCMNYDSFGNRKQSDFQASSCNPASDAATATYNPANQVIWTTVNSATSGFLYDAAGNVLFDGANYYAYDGEGRLCAVQSNPISGGPTAYGYIYDAEGRRVAKGTITPSLNPLTQPLSCNPTSNGFTLTESYVIGQGGEQLTTLNGSQNWVRTNVYGGTQLLATYDTQGLHFHLTDPLGTRRVQTSAAGVAEEDCQGLPFGDGLNCFTVPNAPASADESTPLHFTGKERDAESGNDYFATRYYGSSMGRFMSPDPSGLTYAYITNPQSFNLYSYALNNPLRNIDPTGLYCFYGGEGDTTENDSDPSDYDFLSDGPDECGNTGGQWIDNPSTTVIVSGGGDNGNTLSTFPSDVSLNYQFIPGTGCSAALKTAGANSTAINNYYNLYQAPINNAANSNGVNPNLLAAVGVRESGLPANPDVVQANGNGRGLFQIDLGVNPGVTTAQAFDPSYSANFAAQELSSNMSFLASAHPNFNTAQLAQATAATYNMGLGNNPIGSNISGNPNTIDVGTTGGNYGSNVVAISADCF